MSYIGLDQPGVEPSGDDTSGINRSHVRRELFYPNSHIITCADPEREGGGGGGQGVRIPPWKITKL